MVLEIYLNLHGPHLLNKGMIEENLNIAMGLGPFLNKVEGHRQYRRLKIWIICFIAKQLCSARQENWWALRFLCLASETKSSTFSMARAKVPANPAFHYPWRSSMRLLWGKKIKLFKSNPIPGLTSAFPALWWAQLFGPDLESILATS